MYVGYAESDALTTTLVTVFGVNPGVHLVFGEKYAGWDAHGIAGSMTVNLPAYAGADGYRVSSPCSSIPSASTMITVPINARCQTATTPLAAIAFQGGLPIATSYAPNAPFTPGSVYNAGAWIPSTPITESITGLNGVTKIDLEAGSVGTTFYDGTFISEVPLNGSTTASLLAPRSAPALFAYADPGSPPSGMGRHDYIAKAAIDATQVSLVDPGIPWISGTSTADTIFSWAQTSGTYDAASVVARWARVDASSIKHDLLWSVILPAGMTSFSWYPTLPAELDPFVLYPADLQHIYAPPFVTLVDFSDAATYDAALANPEWVVAAPLNAGTGGDLSAGVAIARSPQ
ncbi:MAG TPA: hypothetical protein VFQ65_07560 [Kofleriaceae bacterium]|nr:hypothetical protein [Kofleriaceae bacterium]